MHAPNPECPKARTLKAVLHPLHPGPVRSTGCPPGGPREVPKRWCPACYHSKPAEKCVPRVKECPCVEGTEVTGPAASYFSYFPAARVDVQGDLSLFSFFFLSLVSFSLSSPLYYFLFPSPSSFGRLRADSGRSSWTSPLRRPFWSTPGPPPYIAQNGVLRAMSGWLATGLRQLY